MASQPFGLVERLDAMAAGWLCAGLPDAELPREAAREIERLRAALERIARWHGEFPATGNFYDIEKTRPTSYGAEYGSYGERDYMRQVALDALAHNVKLTGRPHGS